MSAVAPTPTPAQSWTGVAVLFLAQMLAIGTVSFGYGLFIDPLSVDFGLSRADAGSGLMILIVGMAIWSPLVGRALDTLSARYVLCGAAFAFAAGLAIIAMSRNLLLTAAAAFVLVAGAAAALGPLSGSTLTVRWFTRNRGRALGIVAVSSSMGGFVVVPALGWAISAFGWRPALLMLGAIVAIVLNAFILLLIPNHRDNPAPRDAGRALAGDGAARYTARQLIATRDLWLLIVVVGTMMGISQTLLSILIPYATDSGIALGEATLLVSAASMSSIVGKLAIGALADRIDLRWLQLAVVAMMAAFLGILVSHPSHGVLFAACLLAGMSIGGTTPLWAAFVNMRYGPASVGQAMGLMVFMQMSLIFAALRAAGVAYDRTGSYDAAFVGFLAILPLVALAILPLKPRAVEER